MRRAFEQQPPRGGAFLFARRPGRTMKPHYYLVLSHLVSLLASSPNPATTLRRATVSAPRGGLAFLSSTWYSRSVVTVT
ncbi:MAG: hypothetical protein WCA59_09690 [Candidatus Binataceae bacterium]